MLTKYIKKINCSKSRRTKVKLGKSPPEGLPYIIDGDAHRNFQKKPLKVTTLGVAPANYIPKKLPRKV